MLVIIWPQKIQTEHSTDSANLLIAREEILELKRQSSIVTERWERQQRQMANVKTVKSWHKEVVFLPRQPAVCLDTHFLSFFI